VAGIDELGPGLVTTTSWRRGRYPLVPTGIVASDDGLPDGKATMVV
jgi:hypothetical protein